MPPGPADRLYNHAMLPALALLLCLRSDVRLDLRVLEAPVSVRAGLSTVCRVEVTNAGACGFPPGEPINLSYHWLAPDGTMVVFEGERTPLPLPLEPGAVAEVTMNIKAPGTPGEYRLQLDPVWEHRFWFSELAGGAGPEIPVAVGQVRLRFKGGPFPWRASGTGGPVAVEVKNAGEQPLRADDRVWVGYEIRPLWSREAAERFLPVALTVPLDAGASVTLQVPVGAPGHQGVYRFAWVAASGDGTVLGRGAVPLPVVSQKVTTLLVLCMAAMVAAALVPAWRRRSAPLLAIAPWLWFVLAASWKVMRVGEVAHQWPDLRLGLLGASSITFLGAPLLFLSRRWRGWAFWGLNLLLSLLLFADLVYYRYFGDFPSIATLAHIGQMGAVTGSVPSLVTAQALFLLSDLPLLAVLLIWSRRSVPAPPESKGLRRAVAGGALLACLAMAALEVARSKGPAAGVFRQRFQNANLAAELGAVDYHLYDAGEWAWRKVRGKALSREDRERVTRRFSGGGRPPVVRGPFWGRGRGRNFLLVQEESLEEFALDAEVGGRAVMPFLRGARDRSLSFPSFYDETSHGRTSDAEFMLLTSLHPASAGSPFFLFAGNRFRTLAQIFRENGYTTFYAHPHEKGFWNRYAVYPGFGFDRLVFKDGFAPGRTIGWGLANDDFLEQSVGMLEGLPRPFFALLVTLTDHHPYQDLPIPAEELPLGRLEGTLMGRYLKVCREKDRALERFARRMREAGLLEETVVVLYGDHDAGLGWGRDQLRDAGLPGETNLDLYERDRLPLLIHGPGIGAGAVPRTGGHADLGPTLLELAGLDLGGAPFLGTSLLGGGEGQAVFAGASFRSERLHFVRRGASGRPECWDLAARREVEIARCRPGFERAEERLRVSEAILKGDLVSELVAAPAVP